MDIPVSGIRCHDFISGVAGVSSIGHDIKNIWSKYVFFCDCTLYTILCSTFLFMTIVYIKHSQNREQCLVYSGKLYFNMTMMK